MYALVVERLVAIHVRMHEVTVKEQPHGQQHDTYCNY